MAGTGLNFAAQVDSWVQQTQQRMTAVFRSSVQDVVAEMQKPVGEGGNMPIQTGFLRASIVASKDGLPLTDRVNPDPNKTYSYNPQPVNLIIAGTEIGETIYVGYAANYAGHMEYGTSRISPRAFVRLAAAQWQRIVDQNVVKAKNTVLGGFTRLTKYD